MAKRYTVAQLVLGIKADIKQLRLGLHQGMSEIKSFSTDVSRTTAADMSRLGLGLGAVSSIAMAAGAKGIKVFADFEQAIANTASVTGDTTEGMKTLEKYARKMGKTTVFTATQAGDAMYYLASAGYDAREIMSSLNGILSLAAATQYDLSETTATVVSVLRAFSLDASQASRVANVFAAAISSSQATMLKLQESMKYVSPVAANLNYSVEQTVAALSLLYDSGLEASMSGTQLRMSLTRLLKPTNQTYRAIKKLGLAYSDLDPSVNSLVDITYKLEEANAGAAKSAKYMAQMFGVRAVNAMNILVRNGGSALEAVEERITGTTKAAEMQQRQIDTLKGTWKLMTSAIQETAIIFGSTLKPVVKSLMESFRQLNLWFDEMPGVMRSVIVAIGAVITSFAALSGAILLIAGQLPKIVTSTVILKTAWATFGKKLLGIVGIITTVTGAIVYLTSMQERESRKRKEFLLDYANYLNKREKDAKITINSAKTIKKLNGHIENNITKYNHLKHAIKEINKVNSGLIDEEKDLSLQMDKVKTASKNATAELVKLAKSREKLRQFDIADKLSDATTKLEKLKGSIDKIGVGGVLSSTYKSVTMEGLRTSKDVKTAYLKDMKAVDAGFAKVALTGTTTGTVIKRWQPDILTVRKYVEDLAKTEEGQNKLLEIQNNLREISRNRTVDLRKALDKAGIGEEAISFALNNEVGKKKSIVAVERVLFAIVTGVFKTTKEIVKQEQIINDLKEKQSKKPGKGDGRKETQEELRVERQAELTLQRLLYNITVTGMNNRLKKRKLATEMWYKEELNKLIDANYTQDSAEEALKGAHNRRLMNDREKDDEEINSFELSLMMKGQADIFTYRMKMLEAEKRKSIKEAIALGKSTSKVEAKYEQEKIDLAAKLENQRVNKITSIKLDEQTADAKRIEEHTKKVIALENVRYGREKLDLKQMYQSKKDDVRKGYISLTELQKWYNSESDALDIEHNNRSAKIQSDEIKERLDREKDSIQEMADANAAIKGYNPIEYELEQEKAAYRIRKKDNVEWLAEHIALVNDGKEKEIDVDNEYNLKKRAAYVQHLSKMSAITIGYKSVEYEEKLKDLEKDSSSYVDMLQKYMNYIDEKIALTKHDYDEYARFIELRKKLQDELTDHNKKKTKEYAGFTTKAFTTLGDAIGKTGQGAKYAWKDALKQMVEMSAEVATQMAKVHLILNWGNPFGMAKWGAAIIAIAAAKQVALGRINAEGSGAAYGGDVKTSGVAKVHQGETIIPSTLAANIQRKTWDDMMKKATDNMGGSFNKNNFVAKPALPEKKDINVRFDMNINAEGAVFTPANIDEQDSFYERFIVPAEKRFRDAMESVIERELN